MLSQAEQKVLKLNLSLLETDFPFDSLYAPMVADGILDDHDKANLEAEKNPIQRNRKFFNLILTKPTGTFRTICQLFSQLTTVNNSIGKQFLDAIRHEESNKSLRQGDALTSLDGAQPIKVGKEGQVIQVEHCDDDAAPYFDLIKKTDIPNDRKAINLNKFSTTLGFEHFQVKAIIMNRDRSVEETLHEIFDKWCTEMPNKAIKGTFVKALSNAGLVDVAKLVASSVVESDH